MMMVETKSVCRDFPIANSEPVHVLKGIDVAIPASTLTILRGPSGSGKTTLMNILGALDQPTKGTVIFNGQDITNWSEDKREKLRRKEIGFIFQSVSLIPIMTAYENVEFALRMADKHKNKAEVKERVTQCLEMVGLKNRMDHMPQEMSGGEQQRVAIARAIAHHPNVIFADEPTAELDSQSALMVVEIFKDLVKKEGVTIVMTTHDTSLMGAGDCVFEIEDGEIKHE